MDEEALNTSTRKFLRKFGVTTQRELESGIRAAIASGTVADGDSLEVRAVVTADGVDGEIVVTGTIDLS